VRLGIISDIHSDKLSLQQAVTELETMKCDSLVCLGDIVGFSHHYEGELEERDGNECIRIVKENCEYVIAGNHDLYATKKMPLLFRERGYPEDWCLLDANERKRISADTAWLYEDAYHENYSESSLDYLWSLSETMLICEGMIFLSHFLFPDLTGSTNFSPSGKADFKAHLKLLKKKRSKIGVMGHKHPEGYSAVSKNQTGVYGFRSNTLEEFPVVLIIPAITRGAVRNGYLVLDTGRGSVEAFPLGEG